MAGAGLFIKRVAFGNDVNLPIARGTNFPRFCRFSKIFFLPFIRQPCAARWIEQSFARWLNGSAANFVSSP